MTNRDEPLSKAEIVMGSMGLLVLIALLGFLVFFCCGGGGGWQLFLDLMKLTK